MAEQPKEVKYSCGCFEIDGVLVVECTQSKPNGEISAEQHGASKPFAPRCARKAFAEQARQLAEAKAAPVATDVETKTQA